MRWDAGFATELEIYLFDRSGLGESEYEMTRQEGRLDVYGGAFECKDIRVGDDINA